MKDNRITLLSAGIGFVILCVAGCVKVFGATNYTQSVIIVEQPPQTEEIVIFSETDSTIDAIEIEEHPTINEMEETIEETYPIPEVILTDSERQMMAQLVHSEAGVDSYEVKRLVVDVVFNRVDDPAWPDSIEGVIFQKRQFSVIGNGSFYDAAYELTEDDFRAVDEECYGRQDYGIKYFNDDSIGGCANGKGGWKIEHMWFAY